MRKAFQIAKTLRPSSVALLSATTSNQLQSQRHYLQASLQDAFTLMSNDLQNIAQKPAQRRKSAFKKIQSNHLALLDEVNKALYGTNVTVALAEVASVFSSILKTTSDSIEDYTQKVHHIVYQDHSFPTSFTCFEKIMQHQLAFCEWMANHGTPEQSKEYKEHLETWINRVGDSKVKSTYFSTYHLAMAQAAFNQCLNRDPSDDILSTDMQSPLANICRDHVLNALNHIEKNQISLPPTLILFLLTQAGVWLNQGNYTLAGRCHHAGNAIIATSVNHDPNNFAKLKRLGEIKKTTHDKLTSIAIERLNLLANDRHDLNFPVFYEAYKFLNGLNTKATSHFNKPLRLKQKDYWNALKNLCKDYDVKLRGKSNTLTLPMNKEIFYRLSTKLEHLLTSHAFDFEKDSQYYTFKINNIMDCSLQSVQQTLTYFAKHQNETQRRLEDQRNKGHFDDVMSDLSRHFANLDMTHQEDNSSSEEFVMSYSPQSPTLTGFKMRQMLSNQSAKTKTTGHAAANQQIINNNAQEHDPLFGFDPDKYSALTIREVRSRGPLPKPIYVALDNTTGQDECPPNIRQEFRDHVFSQPKLCKPTGESGFKRTSHNTLMAKHKSYEYRSFPSDTATNKEGGSLYVFSSITNPKKGKNKYS